MRLSPYRRYWPHSVIKNLELKAEELNIKAEKWEKIAKSMAKVLMDLGEGQDEHDKANRLVKKHFPKIYQSYE
jgi:hypothetical protein